MSSPVKLAILSLILVPLLSGARQRAPTSKYRAIEVMTFRAAEGVEVPAKFKITLTADVLDRLRKLPLDIVSEGRVSEQTGPALRLTGTVVGFRGGSRAVRYMAGPVAGWTRVVAHIVVTDLRTSETVAEFDADGKVTFGPWGGDSMGASNGLAKEVAKKVKRRLF